VRHLHGGHHGEAEDGSQVTPNRSLVKKTD
jgi:hypothetical protein